MKPASLAKLRRACAKVGATLDVERAWDSITVNVDAPAGKRWRATGGTILSCFTYLGTAGWVAECYGDVVERMEAGLYDDATAHEGDAR